MTGGLLVGGGGVGLARGLMSGGLVSTGGICRGQLSGGGGEEGVCPGDFWRQWFLDTLLYDYTISACLHSKYWGIKKYWVFKHIHPRGTCSYDDIHRFKKSETTAAVEVSDDLSGILSGKFNFMYFYSKDETLVIIQEDAMWIKIKK